MNQIDDRQVVIFYHVHAINDWERIVNSQISAMCISGLYQRADKIYVCINKPQHWHINLPKFIVLSNPAESLENHSLQKMHDFSMEKMIFMKKNNESMKSRIFFESFRS